MEMQVPQYLTNLAGLNFRDAESKRVVRELTLGQAVRLEREPGNRYDANAIKILATDDAGDEYFIGYVEGLANTTPALRMDKGQEPEAHVAKVYPAEDAEAPKAWMHPLIEINFADD